MEDLVLRSCHPRLADWVGLIVEFGEYYGLSGCGSIVVDSDIYRKHAARYAEFLGIDLI
ncbi:hypothetical protein ACYOEI_13865 [Singulisphaera rosea]